jgi:serine/threonine protein kinase
MSRINQQIGNYRLVKLLGTGGFAEVYLGEHIHLERKQIAVKILHNSLPEEFEAMFLHEAQTVADLKHPGIVELLDYGINIDKTPYLFMEFSEKGCLRTLFPKGSIVPLDTIVIWVNQIADALQYAHDQDVIHRDVKPENVLVSKTDQLLLSDFGISAIAKGTTLMRTGYYAGTVTYSAPEQHKGKPRVQSDQYSLGIMVYEWLCGSVPFEGDTQMAIALQHLLEPPQPLHERVTDISPAVEAVVMQTLAKDPKERFSTIQAFAVALELAHQSVLSLQASSIIVPLISQSPIPKVVEASESVSPTDIPTPLPPNQSSLETDEITSPILSLQVLDNTIPSDQLSQPSSSISLPSASSSTHEVKRKPLTSGLRDDRSTITPRRGPFLRRAFLMSGLVFLILVASSAGLFFFAKSNQIATNNAHATAFAHTATSTASYVVHATATSYTSHTVTAQDYATAPAIALQNLYNSAPTFQDSLADNTNDWGQRCCTYVPSFSGGALHLTTQSAVGPSYFPLFPQKQSLDFSNFALEVEMEVTKGYGGGIIFRGDGESKHYYFIVGTDGSYSLNFSDPTPHPELTSGSTSAIHRGFNQVNRLGVVAIGSNLDLYVNGVKISRVSNDMSTHGRVGLLIFDSGGPDQVKINTEVFFRNLRIWNL